jgi:hypothetical protein
MAGSNATKDLLNKTLMFIIKMLNDNNIKNWFIAYGTLLGMVRDNSCIDGDDDVDIVMDRTHYDTVKNILIQNNFAIEYGYGINDNTNILKTIPTAEYCSIDFYMANTDEKGNFHDTWEVVLWSKCYTEEKKLIERVWNGQVLYLPANSEQKLANRYGSDWRIPMDTKGPTPRKKIL